MSSRIKLSRTLLAINTASALGTRLLGLSVLVWLQQYLLKRVPAEEYSLLAVIYSLMIFAPLFTGTLTSAIKRYVTEAYARGTDSEVTEIVSTMFPLLCVASVILVMGGAGIAWYVEVVFRFSTNYLDEVRVMLMVMVCSVAIRLPLEAFGSGLFVKQRFVLENLIALAGEVVRLGVLLSLLFGVSTSVVWVVMAAAIGDLVKVVTVTVVSRRLVSAQKVVWGRFRWSLARKLTAFGGWDSVDGFAGMLRKASGPLILNRLASPLDVACFHLGSLVSNRLEMLSNNSIAHTALPVVIGLSAVEDETRLRSAYLTLGRTGLWGLLVVVAPLIVHAEEIVALYVGEKYLSAATVMLVLLSCYPIVYGNFLHLALAKARLRMRGLALRNSIIAAFNVGLSVVLVAHFGLGAVGAAAATFVAYGVGSIFLLWPFGKGIVGVSWSSVVREIIVPGVAPFAVAAGLMELLSFIVPVTSWADVGMSGLAGFCAYVATTFGVMGDRDRKYLRHLVGKVRRSLPGEAAPGSAVG